MESSSEAPVSLKYRILLQALNSLCKQERQALSIIKSMSIALASLSNIGHENLLKEKLFGNGIGLYKISVNHKSSGNFSSLYNDA